MDDGDQSRRRFLKELSAFSLSGVATQFCLGAKRVEAARGYNPQEDIFYLNRALTREHEVILSYDFSIETGLFEKTALGMFNFIITDHMRHRKMLEEAINRLGGDPVAPPSREEFRRGFNAELIRTGSDALRFNKRFEGEAFVVYSEIATYLRDPSLVSVAVQFSAEEFQHKSVLVEAIPSIPFDPTLRIRD